MADTAWQYANHPPRKPLPPHLQPDFARQDNNIYTHSRSRTTSSNVFPIAPQNMPQQTYHGSEQQYQSQIPQNLQYPSNANNLYTTGAYSNRRTPSTNTFSTTASALQNNPSIEIRRSSSSRSGSSPTSYVQLMRKQKATVWCDRAQSEDPRILAAQRAARLRAASSIASSASGRTSTISTGTGASSSTSRVAAKIRHHGKAGLLGYGGSATGDGNFSVGVGGVPMRLSATEVEGEETDSEDGRVSTGGYHHRRTGSGRSSLGSGRRAAGLQYRQSGASAGSGTGRWSSGNTPPSGNEIGGRHGSGLGLGPGGDQGGSLTDLAEETPVPSAYQRGRKDYFSTTADGTSHSHPAPARTQTTTSANSGGSGSSGERADAVGELGDGSSAAARLAANSLLKSTIDRNKSTRSGGSTKVDDLRRRGSVDDRTMTITGGVGRLFVANPDLSDDD